MKKLRNFKIYLVIFALLIFIALIIFLQNSPSKSEVDLKERVLKLTLNIDSLDNVNITEMRVSYGYTEKGNEESDYMLKLYSKNEIKEFYFPISFHILADPPIEIFNAKKILFIPYEDGLHLIEIFHNDSLIGIFQAGKLLCNKNKICDGFESYYSCPIDCSTYEKDRVCVPADDGYCDPDCDNKDADCIK